MAWKPLQRVGCKAGNLHMTTTLIFFLSCFYAKVRLLKLCKKTESSRSEKVFSFNTKTPKPHPYSWLERSENWIWDFYSSEKKLPTFWFLDLMERKNISFILHSSFSKHNLTGSTRLLIYTLTHQTALTNTSCHALFLFVPFIFMNQYFLIKKCICLLVFVPKHLLKYTFIFHCRPYI